MSQQHQKQTTTTTRESDTPLIDRILAEGVRYVPFMKEVEVHLTGADAYEQFATPTKDGKLPGKQHVANFLTTCQAKGLDPWDRDAFLVGYDTKDGPVFNVIVAHQAFLKRADAHAAFDGMESGVIFRSVLSWEQAENGREPKDMGPISEREGDFVDPHSEILCGGWAKVYRKDHARPAYRRTLLKTFNAGFGRWRIDPAGMIVKVAEADGLRSSFPNQLGGLHIAEEFHANELKAKERAPITMPEATEEPESGKPYEGPITKEEATPEPIADAKTLQEGMAEQLPDAEPAKSPIMAWAESLAKSPDIDTLNGWLPEIAELETKDKVAVKKMVNAYAVKMNWSIIKGNKFYTPD